jgi:hypothetical protein
MAVTKNTRKARPHKAAVSAQKSQKTQKTQKAVTPKPKAKVAAKASSPKSPKTPPKKAGKPLQASLRRKQGNRSRESLSDELQAVLATFDKPAQAEKVADGKYYVYKIKAITGVFDTGRRVGDTLCFTRSFGETHSEVIRDSETGKFATWQMVKFGTTWCKDGMSYSSDPKKDPNAQLGIKNYLCAPAPTPPPAPVTPPETVGPVVKWVDSGIPVPKPPATPADELNVAIRALSESYATIQSVQEEFDHAAKTIIAKAPELDRERFWAIMSEYRTLLLIYQRQKNRDLAPGAARELCRRALTGEGMFKPDSLLEIAAFVRDYKQVSKDYRDAFDADEDLDMERGDDCFEDLCDALPLAGPVIHARAKARTYTLVAVLERDVAQQIDEIEMTKLILAGESYHRTSLTDAITHYLTVASSSLK